MKRYYLITALLLMAALTAHSQVNLNLALSARPQPWLSEWANPVNGMMIITFMPGPIAGNPDVKIRTTLLDGSGSAIGKSSAALARVYALNAGVNRFSMADALQLQNLAF